MLLSIRKIRSHGVGEPELPLGVRTFVVDCPPWQVLVAAMNMLTGPRFERQSLTAQPGIHFAPCHYLNLPLLSRS